MLINCLPYNNTKYYAKKSLAAVCVYVVCMYVCICKHRDLYTSMPLKSELYFVDQFTQ